jgi:hypothetical protein
MNVRSLRSGGVGGDGAAYDERHRREPPGNAPGELNEATEGTRGEVRGWGGRDGGMWPHRLGLDPGRVRQATAEVAGRGWSGEDRSVLTGRVRRRYEEHGGVFPSREHPPPLRRLAYDAAREIWGL